MTLLEAVQNLLARAPGRWTPRGYGYYACSSCGAQMTEDYDPPHQTRELCSTRCPWRLLEEAAAKQ